MLVHYLIGLSLLRIYGVNARHWKTPTQPNVLVILTDDQDAQLGGLEPMTEVRRLIADSGVSFTNAYTSTPLCCPARASLLMGMYAHNHLTLNNSRSGGCDSLLWRTVMEPNALPVHMQGLGYATFYAGKYLNEYAGEQVPPGWQEFYGLHGNSRYYNYTLRENEQNVSYSTDYLTDVLRQHAHRFLTNVERPFFAMVAPPAAHAPFTPAERHQHTFANQKAPRTPSFNLVSNATQKHWLVSHAHAIPEHLIDTIDEYFRLRWGTLLAVDEMVAELLSVLSERALLENTYIIYTSDNGYHLGQFAQPYDKRQPYQTDVRVPLLIRGPNIASGAHVDSLVSLIDLAPTILDWAHARTPAYMDGISLKKQLSSNGNANESRSLLIEYWGEGNEHTYNPACPGRPEDHLAGCNVEADCHCQDARNNTYACLRTQGYKHDRIYCQFFDDENFVEVYDLAADEYELHNIYDELLGIEIALYEIALGKLMRCSGRYCNNIAV